MCHIRYTDHVSEDKSQPFLTSSAAVTLGIFDIAEMSEEQAESVFEAIRFARTGGEPSCVWCNTQAVYPITRNVKNRKTGAITKRRLFKCQKCLKQFSATSGTAFHYTKLPFKKIMAAILLFVNGEAGTAALRARREIRCNPKTAWILFQRAREVITNYQAGRVLTGEVEIDSTSIGGKVRPANRAKDRKHQPRRIMSKVTTVSVLRERGPGGRVVPFLGGEGEVVRAINTLADPSAELIVDEHSLWNPLFANYRVRQIKHKEQYSDLQGTSTNQAESYFSRYKRMYRGTYCHFWGRYAQLYNGECAWRTEHGRISNGDKFLLLMAETLHHPPSSWWRGYYQRTLRKAA